MYNVLIADDEGYQRLGMKKIIKGLRPEYRIITSTDGKEALNILQNQDINIAFIDVIMPHIDGINLVEKFNKSNKNTRLIIVSAHKDFTYVQKALRMGVFDYISKPIQMETISSLLQKVESDILDEMNRTNERRFLENQLSTTLPVYNGHLLNNWIMGMGMMPGHRLERLMKKRFGLVMLIDIVQAESYEQSRPINPELIHVLVASLENRFHSHDWNAIAFKIDSEHTRIAVVVATHTQTQLGNIRFTSMANEVILDFKNEYDCLCAFGIGGIVDNINDNVKYSYRQAETVLKYLFYTGHPAVLSHSHITQKKVSALDITQKEMLIAAVREHDIEKVCKIIDHIYMTSTTDGYIRPQHFIYTLNMWILDILELYRHVIKPEDFSNLINQFNVRFLEEKIITEYTDHIIQTLSDLIVYIKGSLENKHDEIMKDCMQYLKDNFNKDMGLNEVAAQCYLSPSYFSALFKMHTGITLNQYILDLRMSRAKELLGILDIKIYEIADALGYKDTKYFHRIFKKYYKMTPQEYKSKLRKIGKE